MYILLSIFLIFYNGLDFAFLYPMLGENVKLAGEDQFPFVVSIRLSIPNKYEPEKNHICSGVLISNKDVLTAHHCFDYMHNYNIEMRIGSNDLRKSNSFYLSWSLSYKQWAKLKQIKPKYLSNDIIIIRLNETVSSARPVSLLYVSNRSLYRSNVRVAGFGVSKNGVLSNTMETVEVTIISRRECKHRIKKLEQATHKIPDKYLCGVADPMALMSRGNSGSAVLLNNQLVGIHIGIAPYVDEPYNPEQVNLFVSIDFYQQYINDVISSTFV